MDIEMLAPRSGEMVELKSIAVLVYRWCCHLSVPNRTKLKNLTDGSTWFFLNS